AHMRNFLAILAGFTLVSCAILGCWFYSIPVQGGIETAVPPKGALPDSESVTILNDLQYRTGGSKQWRLDLAMKKGLKGKPRPGIVVIHGGGWIEGGKVSFSSRKYGTPGNIEDFA